MRSFTQINLRLYLSLIFFPLIVLVFSSQLSAEEHSPNRFIYSSDSGIVNIDQDTKFGIEVVDDVSDGCWLNVNSSKSRVERVLVSSGYSNIVAESASITIRLNSMGYSISNGTCVVVATFDVYAFDFDYFSILDVNWIYSNQQNVFSRTVLLSGPKQNMSQRILDHFSSSIDEFIVFVQTEKNDAMSQVIDANASDESKARILNAIQ